MGYAFGIRHETKPFEHRAPITPAMVRELIESHGLEVLIEPSPTRIFSDDEYAQAGAIVSADLSRAPVIMGLKEIPLEQVRPEQTYVFFSHVIKGQLANMPLLDHLMELGCTLIDYEKITDGDGRRLVYFGPYAGHAGAIDALGVLGQRLTLEGTPNPFSALESAGSYGSLEIAKQAVRAVGDVIAADGVAEQLAPLVIGVTGYGTVASGVQEVLEALPTREIEPHELQSIVSSGSRDPKVVYRVTFRERHTVQPKAAGATFSLDEYYRHPGRYRSCFNQYIPHLTVLINCILWNERCPRLVSKSAIKALFSESTQPRLRVISDISCDIEGGIGCTLKSTHADDPAYLYDPVEDRAVDSLHGHGPVIMAVDNLPSELPREASTFFSQQLGPLVPAIARCDFAAPFGELALPPRIMRAVILHRGCLMPDFEYLSRFLGRD